MAGLGRVALGTTGMNPSPHLTEGKREFLEEEGTWGYQDLMSWPRDWIWSWVSQCGGLPAGYCSSHLQDLGKGRQGGVCRCSVSSLPLLPKSDCLLASSCLPLPGITGQAQKQGPQDHGTPWCTTLLSQGWVLSPSSACPL
jgi:hypothetical protein